jgi:hypothetical protein
MSDSKYFKAISPDALNYALYKKSRGLIFKIQVAAGYIIFVIIIAAMIMPFLSPIRQLVGRYIYIHIVVVLGILIWFFIFVLPPPSRAKENYRRGFHKRMKDKRLLDAGLDCSGISATRIAPDNRTLEILVTDEWLKRPREIRLRDTQNFWWLWTTVYLPYDGFDKVFVRLLDSAGNEVGGSSQDTGSLIWVK